MLYCLNLELQLCYYEIIVDYAFSLFFFQAEDGIRDLVRSRGLGDVYKRQALGNVGRLVRIQPSMGIARVHRAETAGTRAHGALSLIHI